MKELFKSNLRINSHQRHSIDILKSRVRLFETSLKLVQIISYSSFKFSVKIQIHLFWLNTSLTCCFNCFFGQPDIKIMLQLICKCDDTLPSYNFWEEECVVHRPGHRTCIGVSLDSLFKVSLPQLRLLSRNTIPFNKIQVGSNLLDLSTWLTVLKTSV